MCRMGDAGHQQSRLLGDRYRLVEQLGAGGMSVVWSGYDEVLGRRVAVKVLASRLANDRAFRHRIRIEAKAAARLCHRHITNVYDYGEQIDGDLTLPYVVMELVDGDTLAAELQRHGAFQWRTACTVAAEVAAALAVAHARGVVHRDITPGNVMLTPGGVKVVDFGISALAGERDRGPDGTLLGTPAYVSPERLDGGDVSPATDVYALGLLLYRMVAGRMPWPAETRTQMLRAHLYTEPEPLEADAQVPPEVTDLVHRCLVKSPDQRPSAAEVAQTLARIAGVTSVVPVSPAAGGPVATTGAVLAGSDGTTILPWSVETDQVTPPPRRRRRMPMEAVAAAAILVTATAGLWTLTGRTPAVGEDESAEAATPAAQACQVRYDVRTDPAGAFTADLTLFNAGAEGLRDYVLSFALPGDQRLTGGEAARWEQQGRRVLVRPASSEKPLAPGDSDTISLAGRHAGASLLPVEFRLGEQHCEVRLSATAIEKTPAATTVKDERAGGPAAAKGGPKAGPGKGAEAKKGPGAGAKKGPGAAPKKGPNPNANPNARTTGPGKG